MSEFTHAASLLISLSPLDFVIAIASFAIGIVLPFGRGGFRIVLLFLQATLLMVRLSKHYFDTHPEARALLHPKHARKLDELAAKLHIEEVKAVG